MRREQLEAMTTLELLRLIEEAQDVIADREHEPKDIPHHEVVERRRGEAVGGCSGSWSSAASLTAPRTATGRGTAPTGTSITRTGGASTRAGTWARVSPRSSPRSSACRALADHHDDVMEALR